MRCRSGAVQVDTGFDGDVCIPVRVAVSLGLELVGQIPIELADGTQTDELLFDGSVEFFGEPHEVQILLTDSEDALIGTSLLDHYPFSIEFPGGDLRLREKRQKKGAKPKGG